MDDIYKIVIELPEGIGLCIVGIASILASVLPPTDKKGVIPSIYRIFHKALQIVAFNIWNAKNRK